ncbi:TPA: LysR family transcriptional regulator, partial [Pseudomonas aeruginosa]|nr:LysR family transcriptional regulator [Pseudomonas aeruginosa]
MNWDDTRVFLALCREHTLRGAARALHVDQATVGRRLASLEAALGSTLFLRTSSGYLLTPAGEAAFELAEKMERSALELLRRTRGMDHRLSGEVRLSTTDSLAVDFVLPALARLHLEHPDIRVLLNSASAVVDLPKRETDIAIRTLRPENPDLILRKLASWPMGLFASADYLRRNGVPVPGERFRGHDLVMYEPYWHSQRELTLGGEPIRDGRVVIAVNSNMMVR